MGGKGKGLQHNEVLKATNQNSYNSIISQTERMKRKIINEVEEILGRKVDKELFNEAYEYAVHKLAWQSRRYNTTYDEMYLAIVTAEVYEQQAFTEFMNSLARRIYYEVNY